MLYCLSDLMEGASDFSWMNAKASHTVPLSVMECGLVTWSDTSRIDRIQHAHVQKQSSMQTLVKNSDYQRKQWYCKMYQ